MENDREIKKLRSEIELLKEKVDLLDHQLKHHINDINTYVHKMGHF